MTRVIRYHTNITLNFVSFTISDVRNLILIFMTALDLEVLFLVLFTIMIVDMRTMMRIALENQ